MGSFRKIDYPKVTFADAPDPGPAAILQWIKITDLVIDDTYQRDLKREGWTAIRRIAANFRWSRFSPVFVAPVEGGLFAIIDGQHRTHAAAMRGFDSVPCQIVAMDQSEQAASFAAVNGIVTKVSPWHIFKAALAAGEPWAVQCRTVCDDAGCVLMASNASADDKKPGEIYALSLVKAAISGGNTGALKLVLSSLRRSEFGEQAQAYSNEIIKPLLMAVVDRPWLVRMGGGDLSGFLDDFDIYLALDQADDITKRKRRIGEQGISRFDMASALIGEGLDKAFPQRMALPAPEAAE